MPWFLLLIGAMVLLAVGVIVPTADPYIIMVFCNDIGTDMSKPNEQPWFLMLVVAMVPP